MADDKSKRGRQDRSRISSSEAYEVGYFARKHGLDREAAEAIIKAAKGSRERANALAEERKS